jgi:hypothetical protein
MKRMNKEYLEKSFKTKIKEIKKIVEIHMKNGKCFINMCSIQPNGRIALTQYCCGLKKEDIYSMLANSLEELNKTPRAN